MEQFDIQSNSDGWLFFVKAAFVISLITTVAGILFMPVSLMTKGYFALSSLFMLSATITMSKTMRDEHESKRLINKINDAKTSKIINEFAE